MIAFNTLVVTELISDIKDQLELRKLKWEARHTVFVIFLLHFEQVFFVRTYV
ncbi:hypothetical protein ACMD2_27143 [Ananas comosus]|uniref:Uncharacterized protein n=1 Tax=Ananas comosus TaxID=4615 RepID=A0A199V085_ANACO|nr:hypothetical protein ACMD2_27143 [Ananas comosus]